MRSKFITWYFNKFRSSSLCCDMERIVEGSPWHREKNVLVHTDMVVSQAVGNAGQSELWGKNQLITALVAAFHDVGKPQAEEVLTSPERGTYRRYTGHEKISARLWEDYVVTHWNTFATLGLETDDIYKVGWLIEHHLPYGIKKCRKLQNLHTTVQSMFGEAEILGDVLAADCWGRISDDHEHKKETTNEWIRDFLETHDEYDQTTRLAMDNADDSKPTLTMLIGPSGCGKSTWLTENPCDQVYSWDTIRMDVYGGNYTQATQAMFADKTFRAKFQPYFTKYLPSKKDIVVDNTNLSPKVRAFCIERARQHGYRVRAVLFPIPLEVLIKRANTREDKTIPVQAIHTQYNALSLPSYGEMDEVIVIPYNHEESW